MPDESAAPVAGQVVVAGSVGRASIGAMVAALLHAAGAHTVQLDARFLHSPLERIRVDGRPLDAGAAQELLDGDQAAGSASEAIDRLLPATIGRLDRPWLIVSRAAPLPGPVAEIVFAPILPERDRSAAEGAKAILASLPPAPVAVSSLQRESVLDVLRAAYPSLVEVAAHCRLARGQANLDGQEFRLKTDTSEYRLRLPLLGAFQVENAATAVLAVEQLPAGLDPGAARAALDGVRLPGRMEVIKRRPLVIVDSNDAGQAFRRTADALRELAAGRPLHVVLDLSEGLDAAVAAPALAALTQDVAATGPAPLLGAYRDACRAAELPFQTAGDITAAVDQALAAAGEGEAIAVLGSARAAGAARAALLGLLPAEQPLH